MSNSLADLLARKDFDEPPEMQAIKTYVQATFQSDVEVQLRNQDIIITTSSAALANSLRLKLPELRKKISSDKRLIIRIR